MEGWRENRREERMRVEVRGVDSSGNHFSRYASTVNLSRRGACLDWAEWVCNPGDIIEIEHAGQAATFQIVWVGPAETPLEGRIGVRALDPKAYKIWGIPLPRPWRLPRTAEEQIRAALAWFAPTLLNTEREDGSSAGAWNRSVVFRAVFATLSLSLLLFASAVYYFFRARDLAGEGATAKAAPAVVELQSPVPVDPPLEPIASVVESAPAKKETLAVVEAPPPLVTPGSFRYAVQVGAYRNHGQAEAVARRLSSDFKLVEVSPVLVRGETLHRVRIPAETREVAEQHAARIREANRLQTLVIRRP